MSGDGPFDADPLDRGVDPAALDELQHAFADPTRSSRLEPVDADADAEPVGEVPQVSDADAEPVGEVPQVSDADAEPAHDVAPTAPARSVIAIADDELPDAVYLEGDLRAPGDRSDGASVVYIADDGSEDAVVPVRSGALGPGIEPRLRERRIAVRRAEGRRRLRWFVVAGAVAVLVIGALAVLGSPLFSIERSQVTLTGNVYTDPVALEAIVDDLVGTPTLLVDTNAIERRLEQIPWVDAARVRTRFPRAATVEIRERAAQATFQGPDGRFRVIDRDGRVLDVIDGQPIAYMLITGPDALDLAPGQFAPVGYAAAAELVQALTASVRGRTTSVDVTADGSQLRLFLDDGIEVRFGAADELLVKLVRLETVLPAADERGARVVDISTAQVTLQ